MIRNLADVSTRDQHYIARYVIDTDRDFFWWWKPTGTHNRSEIVPFNGHAYVTKGRWAILL